MHIMSIEKGREVVRDQFLSFFLIILRKNEYAFYHVHFFLDLYRIDRSSDTLDKAMNDRFFLINLKYVV